MIDRAGSQHWVGYGDRATARHAAARQHHPDVGGSAAALSAAFEAIDRAYGRPSDGADGVPIIFVHRTFTDGALALVLAGALRSAMALKVIRGRLHRIARSDVRGARRARSTPLEDQP